MTTTIGPNTRIDGRLEGDDDVIVEGRVEGTVVLSNSLTILDGAFVSGEIHVRVLEVEGALAGIVHVSELVHLRATAQVSAEIFATAIRMDSGAKLEGTVEMDVDAVPPPPRRVEPRRDERPARQPARAAAPIARQERVPREERVEPTPPTRVVEPTRPAPQVARATTPSRAPAAAKAPAQTAAKATTTTTTVDPDDMTVKELRDLLKAHDLPVSGTKQDLVDRIREMP